MDYATTDGYDWLTAREHALRRPDALLGPINRTDLTQVVFVEDEEGRLVPRTVTVSSSPALLKFVDEILTNALRSRPVRDPVQSP